MLPPLLITKYLNNRPSKNSSQAEIPSGSSLSPKMPRVSLFRPSRLETLSLLRHVGRVHAPESDMRPVLPHRDLLFRTLSPLRNRPNTQTTYFHTQKKKNKKTFTSQLVSRARIHAARGDMEGFAHVVRDVIVAPSGVNKSVCMRAVAVEVVSKVARTGEGVNAVMAVLVEEGGFGELDGHGVGMVIDLLVRGMLWRGDVVGAVRGEILARALEVQLRRGTYGMLIERVGLDEGLGVLHWAVGRGVSVSRRMLHAVLKGCLEVGDWERVGRVLAEMGGKGIEWNCETVAILVGGCEGVEEVGKVLGWVLEGHGGVRLNGKMGVVFIEGFLNWGGVEEGFGVVEEFFRRGVGVEREGIEALIQECGRRGWEEGALRGWRELRRAWMGGSWKEVSRGLGEVFESHGRAALEGVLQRWQRDQDYGAH